MGKGASTHKNHQGLKGIDDIQGFTVNRPFSLRNAICSSLAIMYKFLVVNRIRGFVLANSVCIISLCMVYMKYVMKQWSFVTMLIKLTSENLFTHLHVHVTLNSGDGKNANN